MIHEYFRQWRQRRQRDREISEELEFHLQLCIEENLAAGMSPRESEADARARFGDFKEIHRTCCHLAADSEPDNTDPILTYSPLSVSLNTWFLIGLFVPAGLLFFFTPHLVRSLPYQDPDALYVTPQAVPLISSEQERFSFFGWQDRNSVFSDLAGFAPLTVTLQHPTGDLRGLGGLSVSTSFFKVLQARPLLGATFSDNPHLDPGTPAVVVSYRLWKEKLKSDPDIIGKTLLFNRHPMRIVAVMPEDFWFLSTSDRFWLPMEFAESWPGRVRVVGRLQAGVTFADMVWELGALTNAKWDIGTSGWIVPLPELSRRSLRAALAMMLVPLCVTLALGFLQIMSLSRLVAPARLKGTVVLRYYTFLLCKSALALLPVAALWVVLTDAAPGSRSIYASGLRPTATLIFLTLCSAMVWWSLIDQSLRCPVCFRRLRMPVSLGTLGSILFDLPSTEYICTHGHGTLHVPEPHSNELEMTRWKPHGDVWEELLATAKK